jgi:hypothetical protein
MRLARRFFKMMAVGRVNGGISAMVGLLN